MSEKVRIHIDEYAENIIKSDIQSFNLPKAETIPAFISKLILSYYRNNSTFFPDDDVQRELNHLLKVKSINDSVLEDIRKIVNNKKTISKKSLVKSIHFRPSIELMREIENDSDPDAELKVIDSFYIDNLINDYVHRPYDERERIFFGSTFDIIEYAIENKKNLTYTKGKTTYNILPYKLLTSTPTYYSYLIGKTAVLGKKNDPKYTPVSLRVTYLNNINLKINDSTHLTKQLSKKEIEELNTRIKEKGIQFLSFETMDFKVKLTPEGIIDYNKHMNIRPLVKSIEPCNDGSGCKIYNFTCSENQIEAYFFKFGAKAEILEPEETRKRFKEHYQAALNLYSE